MHKHQYFVVSAIVSHYSLSVLTHFSGIIYIQSAINAVSIFTAECNFNYLKGIAHLCKSHHDFV